MKEDKKGGILGLHGGDKKWTQIFSQKPVKESDCLGDLGIFSNNNKLEFEVIGCKLDLSVSW
jgi:hypothetical protein